MSDNNQLRDAYRQPGFIPRGILRRLDFEGEVFGLRLIRRRKKLSAACAVERLASFTINDPIGSATSTARIDKFTWRYISEGFSAAGVRQ